MEYFDLQYLYSFKSTLRSFQPLFLQIFSPLPSPHPPPSLGLPMMHLLVYLMVSHRSLRFCSHILNLFFFLILSLYNFHCLIFRITNSSACSNILFFFFLIFIYLFIYLFMAVLGLHLCARALSSCGERGPLFIAVRGPLTIAASPAAEHRLQTHRLSNCSSWA